MNSEPEDADQRPGRGISDPEKKTLFALSGNRCAFPQCRQPMIHLSANPDDPPAVVGKIAHIVAHSIRGPRSDPSFPPDKLNSHENLILLCATCHDVVDKHQHQYNVHVLRQMKRDHEARLLAGHVSDSQSNSSVLERIYASAMPLSHLPMRVYSAQTKYRKQTLREMLPLIGRTGSRNSPAAFELLDDRLYAFHDLSNSEGPFSGVCEYKTSRHQLADEMWRNHDQHRLYVTLLNRALSRYLMLKGVRYQPEHKRYYFLADREKGLREVQYTSLAGRRETRSVVWNPITRITGKPKKRWLHMAASLSFHNPSAARWILAIRPERYITKDGQTEYDARKIGAIVTKLKSTMRNRLYFSEVKFWTDFITEQAPRLVLSFERQHIAVESTLLTTDISWPGVPDDDQKVAEIQPDEDLFSLAQRSGMEDDLAFDDDAVESEHE